MRAPDLSPSWPSIVARLGRVADLEASARAFGALRRVRKVRRAEDLLRLALLYGPGQLSLRGTAAVMGGADLAELSDTAVLGRLRGMGDWLEHLLQGLLEQERGLPCGGDGLRLALVDGSVICAPGSTGARANDWRLHARYDPGRGRFGDLVVRPRHEAERVDLTRIEAGQTVVQDRGYARVRDFAAVLSAGADFITRIGWRALRLRDGAGQPLDPLALLPADEAPVEQVVYVAGLVAGQAGQETEETGAAAERAGAAGQEAGAGLRPLRLVVQALPAAQAARQQARAARRSSRSGHVLDPRTTRAAGYLMVLTSLPADVPAARVLALYRARWQIELGFKRLKTLAGMDKLPASDPALARTWLLAHLILAVMTEATASRLVAPPP